MGMTAAAALHLVTEYAGYIRHEQQCSKTHSQSNVYCYGQAGMLSVGRGRRVSLYNILVVSISYLMSVI